jgi:thiol:disulfide interchange protein DsbA
MSRFFCLSLLALVALTACGSQAPAPTATQPSTPSSASTNEAANTDTAPPAPQPSAPASETTATASEPATSPPVETAAAAKPATPEAAAESNESTHVSPPASANEAAAPAPAPLPEGPEPRVGVDYTLIDPPQPLIDVPGKVEIAEVFSYTCIHCARLDPLLPAWRASLPAQVNFVPVPMAYGAVESLARGFYAAQAMGLLDKTHTGMFTAVAQEHKLKSGGLEDVVKLYADLGVDAEALKATAMSFTVNTQISRNQRTVTRWAIEGTPTLVVAGKYKVVATAEGGHAGMLRAARWLALKEIADRQLAAQ